jgi:hypothetical protein
MATHMRITDAQMIRQYKQRAHMLEDGSRLIHLEKGLVDVFTGTEWIQHSRYRYANARWHYIQGHRLGIDWLLKNMPVMSSRKVANGRQVQ